MKIWKKVLLTLAAVTLGSAAGVSSIHASSSQVNSELKQKGELTIGLEGTYSPFSYRKDGKLTGFEVDLGKAVAKEMGLKAKFVPSKWDSLVAGLGSGLYHCEQIALAHNEELFTLKLYLCAGIFTIKHTVAFFHYHFLVLSALAYCKHLTLEGLLFCRIGDNDS